MIQLSFEDRLELYEPLTRYFRDLGFTYDDDCEWNDINQGSRRYSFEVKSRFFDLVFNRKNSITLTLLAQDKTNRWIFIRRLHQIR